MPETRVEPNAERHLDSSDTGSIVAGVLSYNNAETIANVIHIAREGLSTYFPGSRCIVVNADGGSKDGTQTLAQESIAEKKDFIQVAYPIHTVQKFSPEYFGVPGKTSALRAVCAVASEQNAKVCVMVDSNIRSLTPEWVERLARPVVDRGFDFVAGCYLRHKYDGTIFSGIVYPLARALYGKRIYQPMGGEFALSAKLIQYFLQQPQWDGDVPGSGSDLWLTTQAVSGGFRLAQAFLGP